MKEFARHLQEYFDHWIKHFNTLLPESEWGNRELAERFLQKYWLSESEYTDRWQRIQDQIFCSGKSLPDLIFRNRYKIIASRGGCLFLEDDFKNLQSCFTELGDRHFVVIEDNFGGKSQEASFRIKFPSNITWEEMKSGNYI